MIFAFISRSHASYWNYFPFYQRASLIYYIFHRYYIFWFTDNILSNKKFFKILEILLHKYDNFTINVVHILFIFLQRIT